MTTHHETIDPELERMLREIRPEADEEFLAELDRCAAVPEVGFGGRRVNEKAAWERLADRIRRIPPRRVASGIGATALACIVLGTTVMAVSGPEGSDDAGGASGSDAPVAALIEDAGPKAIDEAAPAPQATSATDGRAGSTVAPALQNRSGEVSGDISFLQTESLALAPTARRIQQDRGTGPFAADRNTRAIERSAQLTLGTDAEGVRDAADDIFGIVGRYEGIVISSSIQDGPEGEAGARFELMIPSARLSDALADLSAVAEVRSREEQTLDITAPTVTTGEKLQDARAEVEGLLNQLADADTDDERAAVKQQLAFQRQRVANLRSTLSRLERRANLSRVSLDVVTGDAATFPGPAGDDDWTIGDALDDAGKILATAAGVTLIGLAVLAPFALIALLGWLVRRAWIRQGRERALEA